MFEHNGIEVTTPNVELCCGMPKLELGGNEDLERETEFETSAVHFMRFELRIL